MRSRGASLGIVVLGCALAVGAAWSGTAAWSETVEWSGRHAGALARGLAGSSHSAAAGYLGIDVRDVSEEQVTALRLRDTHGAVIVKVDHDGPAGKMGLRERDVVIQMNGVAVEGEDQMRRMLHEMAPGHAVALVILRDGSQMTMTTQMADREQVERQAWVDHLGGPQQGGPQAPATGLPVGDDESESFAAAGPSVAGGRYSRGFLGNLLMTPSYTGAVLEKMGPQLAGFFGVQGSAGLLVRSVETNSPAAMAGMHAGDVVVRANAHAVGSVSEWTKLIKEAKGKPVIVVVMRERAEKTLTITPDGKRRSALDGAREPQVAVLMEL